MRKRVKWKYERLLSSVDFLHIVKVKRNVNGVCYYQRLSIYY